MTWQRLGTIVPKVTPIEVVAEKAANLVGAMIPQVPDASVLSKDITDTVAGRLPQFVDAAVAKAVAKIPIPKDGRDGRDADMDAFQSQVAAAIASAVADLGVKLTSLVKSEVAAAVTALPPAKDGKNGRDGRDGLPGRDGLAGAPGEKGLDGKDGRDGIDGKDGRDGRDGVDGLGFDDFEEVLDVDGRSLLHIYRCGERSKEYRLTFPWLLDRGIWDAAKQYHAGDVVSRNGCMWIAQKDTKALPGDGSADWRLSVKHGRDGKQGPPGPQGEKGLDGKDGRPGKDLTQMDEKGRKW